MVRRDTSSNQNQGVKFEPDYFAEAELEEMGNLIEIFAQRWVGTSEISEASHQEIRAWRKMYSRTPNANIDPMDEFGRDITAVPEDELSVEELKYLTRRRVLDLAV